MPEITDHPPQGIAAELAELSAALDDTIPPKVVDRNLIIATWNIWHLGGLTQAWRSAPDADPIRHLHGMRCIARQGSADPGLARRKS